jgi:hypothetical protein
MPGQGSAERSFPAGSAGLQGETKWRRRGQEIVQDQRLMDNDWVVKPALANVNGAGETGASIGAGISFAF